MDGNSSIDINGLMAVNVLIHNGADLSQLYIKGNNV